MQRRWCFLPGETNWGGMDEQGQKEATPIQENEVRVTATGRLYNYINYAASLLLNKSHKVIVLKGMGRAINKTVSLAEILKRRVKGLHQNTEIGSVDVTDTWETKDEAVSKLEVTRQVSIISITLSSEPLEASLPGYQPPLPEEDVKPLQTRESPRPARVPRRGRSGEQSTASETNILRVHGADSPAERQGPRRRGRGRGPGRGRGSGRARAVTN